MKPSELFDTLVTLVDTPITPFVWGPVGVGKSQIIRQVGLSLGLAELLDIRLSQFDAVDLRGLPTVSSDGTRWLTPALFPRDGTGILLFDEMNSAPRDVQAACYQLALDRQLGEYEVPEGWVIMCAGNPASEQGITHAMARPLQNRLCHLTLEPDLTEWCHWALQAHIRPEVIGFLRFRSELLFQPHLEARTWEFVSWALEAHERRAAQRPAKPQTASYLFAGLIGNAAAAEFVAFLDLMKQLPSIDSILLNPDVAPVPVEPSACYAISLGLGRVVTDHGLPQAARYLKRVDAEFETLAMHQIARRLPQVTHTREYIDFSVRNAPVLQ